MTRYANRVIVNTNKSKNKSDWFVSSLIIRHLNILIYSHALLHIRRSFSTPYDVQPTLFPHMCTIGRFSFFIERSRGPFSNREACVILLDYSVGNESPLDRSVATVEEKYWRKVKKAFRGICRHYSDNAVVFSYRYINQRNS